MSQPKLAAKLVKILGAMGSVEKKGYNAHQKYHYMREVDIMEALKAQLIENDIIMLTSSKFADIQKKEGKEGKVEFVTTVETTHTFLDSETQEQLSITSVGSGYDSSDKGASKAITAAVKYAIMKTFMVSDEGSDIENDGVTAQAPAAAPRTGFNRGAKAAAVAAPVATTAKVETPVVATNTVQSGSPTQAGGTTPTAQTNGVTGAKSRFGSRNGTVKTEPSFP